MTAEDCPRWAIMHPDNVPIPIPLVVSEPSGDWLFRITPEGTFEWGDHLDIDETARILAEAVTAMLGLSEGYYQEDSP